MDYIKDSKKDERLSWWIIAENVPSSCCSRFHRDQSEFSQIGGCFLHKDMVESRPGCGLLFNDSFKQESAGPLTNLHIGLAATFFTTAFFAIGLSWKFSQKIEEVLPTGNRKMVYPF